MNNPTSIYQDESLEDRKIMISSQSESTQLFKVREPFDSSETAVFKDAQCRIAIKILHKIEEKKEATADFNVDLKKLETEKVELLNKIEHGYEDVEQKVYLCPDQVSGKMDYYSSAGHLVYTRILTPNERQLKMAIVNQDEKVV